MKANGLVGFMSGIVAYTNNDNGIFHCQIESDIDHTTLTWSVDGVESKVTTGDIYQDATLRAAFSAMLSGVPDDLTWTNAADSSRTIRDLVMHLTAIYTGDDGSIHPASITYENGEITAHTPIMPPADIPTNVDDLVTLIENMLEEIVTTAAFA